MFSFLRLFLIHRPSVGCLLLSGICGTTQYRLRASIPNGAANKANMGTKLPFVKSKLNRMSDHALIGWQDFLSR